MEVRIFYTDGEQIDVHIETYFELFEGAFRIYPMGGGEPYTVQNVEAMVKIKNQTQN